MIVKIQRQLFHLPVGLQRASVAAVGSPDMALVQHGPLDHFVNLHRPHLDNVLRELIPQLQLSPHADSNSSLIVGHDFTSANNT